MDLTTWRKKYNIPTNKKLKDKALSYQQSKSWYDNSYQRLKICYGQNTELFINLLAVTSPRNSVKRNLALADKALTYYLQGKTIDFSFGLASKQIENNVNKVLQNKSFGGQKVNAFAKALLGDKKQIVIDSWMMKAFNLKRIAPNTNDIKHIKTIINKIAAETNLEPAEVQACLWSYAKNELNDSPFKEDNDFSYYLTEWL